MQPIDPKIYWALVKSDLKTFLLQCFETLNPGHKLSDNWHIDAIVYLLVQCIEGKLSRVIINLPPRQLKSILVSVVLPAFILGLDPKAKIICISYSDELAKTLTREFRRIVDSSWYRQVFPEVQFTKNTESEIVTDQGGGRYATSIDGTLTGRGADFIIIDDPIKPEETNSPKIRHSTNEWLRSTAFSRLEDKSRSVLLILMQRLHKDDMTGAAEAIGGFHKLSLPAIAVKDEYIEVSDTETYFRQAGEPLHAARDTLASLEKTRNEVGSHYFSAQYQQDPEPPGGGIFKQKWINIVDRLPKREPNGQVWVSLDPAVSTSDAADFSAICVMYAINGHYYFFHFERGHWEYETIKSKILGYMQRNSKANLVIEHAGPGITMGQHLKSVGINYLPYIPRYDKITRAHLVTNIFESGRIFMVNTPGKNAWLEPCVNEIVTFPFGSHDDQVDSMVQALIFAEAQKTYK